MEDCRADVISGQAASCVLGIRDAEKRIAALLNSGADLGVCTLITAELDDLPMDDAACLNIEKKADISLLRIFAEHGVVARNSSSIIIFACGIRSRQLVMLQMEQLCDLLRFVYEENGAAGKTSCAADMVLWDTAGSTLGYDWLKHRAAAALDRQRQRDLNGYIILEANAEGVFHECSSKLPPEQIFDKISIGVLLLQGAGQYRCAYHNRYALSLLGLEPDCDGAKTEELFGCLREQDRVTLETMVEGNAEVKGHLEITAKARDGRWMMFRMLPMPTQNSAPRSLLISVSDITGARENDLEAKLAQKKLEIISDTTCLPMFEVDIATRTLTLSPQIPHLYYCKGTVVKDAPETCLKCCECMQRSSMEAYCSMFDEIFAGKAGGTVDISIRSRLTDTYLPVKFTWKSIADDHGKPVKAVGVVDSMVNGWQDSGEESAAELKAKLYLEEKYFRKSEDYLKTLRKYRHDCKNYAIALMGFIKDGKTEEALEFLGKISSQLRAGAQLVNTGNAAVDSIISQKLQIAINKGVSVEQIVGLPPELDFDMVDLCLAVASCLDNAIEAVSKVLEAGGKAFIDFQLVERNNVIVMKLSNSFIPVAGAGEPAAGTTKADKLNHGFGLQNVRNIVKKHSGNLMISHSEDTFTTAFTLFA